jgi:hypothetical protein
MNIDEVKRHIKRISEAAGRATEWAEMRGVSAQAVEFMRICAGPKSSFTHNVANQIGSVEAWAQNVIAGLAAFETHLDAGLNDEISPKRQAQIEVVSDLLEQSRDLLEAKGVHPAAPIVLAGATLEEFLRNWIEAEGISLGQRKPSINGYAEALLSEEKITKQDHKDIIAWAGLRNHAAHGHWEEVSEKQRAAIMLDGINLFLRKYSAPGSNHSLQGRRP